MKMKLIEDNFIDGFELEFNHFLNYLTENNLKLIDVKYTAFSNGSFIKRSAVIIYDVAE